MFHRSGLFTKGGLAAAVCAVLLLVVARVPAQAQNQKIVPCPAQQQNLIPIPEIKSNETDHKLKATLRLVDGVRTMWGFTGDPRCASQNVRYFQGVDPAKPTMTWPAGTEPIPGPTFRARVGDLVEITFFNEININNFSSTLDRSTADSMEACDQYTASVANPNTGVATTSSANQYGRRTGTQTGIDKYPNCLHGSSTTNVHFHGTHTTPSTSGDNVLLFIRPALRNGKNQLQPSEAQTTALLTQPFYKQCEKSGPPKLWTDMPGPWQTLQKTLLQQYDATAPFQGHNGKLPLSMQIWPADASEIAQHLWPQYHIGATAYCFPLPKFDAMKMRMGQSPGTHWYHAHKHGSTALNVANGMTGAFIIEGQYDDDLHAYYGANLREQVLMIQQLSTAPFPLTNPSTGGPGSPNPQISVNGRLDPVVTMKPGEVQLWRIVNGAFRDAVQFAYFKPQPPSPAGIVPPPPPQCDPPGAPTPAPTVRWRQIAQDGVQFRVENYQRVGTVNNAFNLAPANRADLLVKAPATSGKYTLCIVRNNGLLLQTGVAPPGAFPRKPSVLLTVNVDTSAGPAMDFIPDAKFPVQPGFLADIKPSEIHVRRQLVFGAGNTTIDGKAFSDHHVDQSMQLNTAEEWVVMNEANDKSHPFHIHINPFQIIEVFQPNSTDATTKGNPCYVDPNNPATFDPQYPGFKPCAAFQVPGPWVWWDTFAIPTGQQIQLTCQRLQDCPPQLQAYTKCTPESVGNPATCTEFIPGWFRMRSKFVDFTGQYVLHCHILVHEDRGMMQLIEVVPDTSPYTHH